MCCDACLPQAAVSKAEAVSDTESGMTGLMAENRAAKEAQQRLETELAALRTQFTADASAAKSALGQAQAAMAAMSARIAAAEREAAAALHNANQVCRVWGTYTLGRLYTGLAGMHETAHVNACSAHHRT
jgi:hypothetical protein